jgi:hypothetical protein
MEQEDRKAAIPAYVRLLNIKLEIISKLVSLYYLRTIVLPKKKCQILAMTLQNCF